MQEPTISQRLEKTHNAKEDKVAHFNVVKEEFNEEGKMDHTNRKEFGVEKGLDDKHRQMSLAFSISCITKKRMPFV